MTTVVLLLLAGGIGFLLVLLFKVWNLVNQSLPGDKLGKLDRLDTVSDAVEKLSGAVSSLQAQLGRDSAFQSDLQRVLAGVQTASIELAQLKGERESDLREWTRQLSEVRGALDTVSTTLVGRRSGAAGENILREALRAFPVEWIRSPYYDVEFGFLLFDRRVLPLDSKFSATELLEQMERLEEAGQKAALSKEIERRILVRAKEVAKYIDPHATTTFAICAVPDSVYPMLKEAHIRSYQEYKVIIISYSLTVPFLLALYDMSLKSLGRLDERRLEAFLVSVEQSVKVLKDNLENKVKEANTRLSNAYRDCTQAVGTIEGALAALKSSQIPSPMEEETTLTR